jgi:hypothetical protein
MHKSAMKYNEALGKWCKNKHGASKIMDTLETYQVAHFIPIKTVYNGRRLAEIYLARIVSLHGVPKVIVSDRGSQFSS